MSNVRPRFLIRIYSVVKDRINKYHCDKLNRYIVTIRDERLMEDEGSKQWDAIGFVISSQYRVAVLRHLAESPATPSRIAAEEDYQISHISNALTALRDRSLVELLVPEERKKGRIYGLTSKGERVWERIKDQKMA